MDRCELKRQQKLECNQAEVLYSVWFYNTIVVHFLCGNIQEYEDRIQSLQEQVEKQSMMSSNTQDDSALDYETTSEWFVVAMATGIRVIELDISWQNQ